MSEKDLEKKLDLVLHNQEKTIALTPLLFGWTGLVVGYAIGLIAPTAFVLLVSNIIIIFSSWFFIVALIRFIRTRKKS